MTWLDLETQLALIGKLTSERELEMSWSDMWPCIVLGVCFLVPFVVMCVALAKDC